MLLKELPNTYKRELLEFNHAEISLTRQCELLGLNRSSAYYKPIGESAENLQIMRQIDELHLKYPFFGVERLRSHLPDEYQPINSKRIRRLVHLMGLETLYPKRNLSKKNEEHEIYPYLLRGVKIIRPMQVLSTDITYIPMKNGYLYLCAVIDWYSRFVTAWRISNTLSTTFCKEAVIETFELYGTPEIFNTDQGSQFTSKNFINLLKEKGIKISMDGKGRALDNIFSERLWRTVKYEDIYLKAYEDGKELHKGMSQYFHFYNNIRKHQALYEQTPKTFFNFIS